MRVAGIGFRENAPVSSLQEALEAAGGNVQALATAKVKAAAPQIVTLSERMTLPLVAVSPAELAAQQTITQSDRVMAQFGTGSVAEAAALAAAGPGAQLLGPRVSSKDGMATAAIAEGISQ
ncbi:cobalamin biosynthesis protein [Actibacterium lipolyticum]|uniref:Cobalamin biosynthesis protein CbiG n=1 Tax=Actibacterium lipolyticum TaxID=1524263 RepID=A0A238JXG7_9RHOB|nr:cobalamin biosynthesis protein [Actibacterium lipolyticum]SMX34844.1 cobalamin biosynthesis protein CbiG [Actibacterium lipolyticum]